MAVEGKTEAGHRQKRKGGVAAPEGLDRHHFPGDISGVRVVMPVSKPLPHLQGLWVDKEPGDNNAL